MSEQTRPIEEIPPSIRPKRYWDLHVGLSDKQLGKLMKTIVFLYGRVTDHMLIGHNTLKKLWKEGGRLGTNYVHVRIELPEGMDKEFEEMTGWKLIPPPKVHLN